MSTPHSVRHSPAQTGAEIYDPFEGFNRRVTAFNNGADKILISPISEIYKALTPKFIRKGIGNASRNVGEPLVFINEVLQLDAADAAQSLGRFVVNSTIGLGGFIDIAAREGFAQPREDFGQTLAVYDVPPGPYLVLPLLGPSNARDLIGRVGDRFADPLNYIDFRGDRSIQVGSTVGTLLDARIKAEPFLDNIQKSADPYISLRGLYTQNRLVNIHEDADQFDGFADFDDDDDGDELDDGFADFE